MKVYFATNEKYYSGLFRKLFDEPVSHVGLGFFSCDLSLVVDCTKPHGKVYHIKHWKSKYRIIYYMDLDFSQEIERFAYRSAVDAAVMVPYDWGAYYYGLLVAIRRFVLGTPLPVQNLWQDPKLRHCTEIIEPLKTLLHNYDIDIRKLDLAAMTPHMLGKALYEQSIDNNYCSWPIGGPNAHI